MFFNKLLLKEFGQFNNKEIELKSGINLIYGKKASGKSTIKDFIVSMFYGIDKSRNIGDGEDVYELRKPENINGFSGKAYINHDGKNCLIERSFLRHNRRTTALEIQSGREIKLKNDNTLYGTLFDVDKNTYVNTHCISQDILEAEVTNEDDIKRYLGNIITTGSADIDKAKVIGRLKAERKKHDTADIIGRLKAVEAEMKEYENVEDELKGVREQIRESEEEFAMETAKRKREARKLIETKDGETFEDNEELNENLDELTHQSLFLDADLLKDYKPEKKFTDKLWVIILTGLFVIGVITAMVYILPFESGVRQLFILCTVLFVIVTIVEGMYAKGFLNGDVYTPSEEEFKRVIYELERKKEAFEDVEIDMSFAKEFIDKKAELKDIEKALLDKKQRLSELLDEHEQIEKQREAVEREIDAINYAINTFNEISADIRADKGLFINGKAADYVELLTEGSYTDVRLDNKLNVMISDGSSFVGFDTLSQAAKRQIKLAIRLGVARIMCKDKQPVVVDDIFNMLNDAEIEAAIKCLNSVGTEQVIMLTSNPAVGKALNSLGIEYNNVEL